ncbi:MAG: DUF5696 domain-containing protein [Saccharofermentanales bacterium]
MNRKVIKNLKYLVIPVLILALLAALSASLGVFRPKTDLLASHFEPAITELYPMESFVSEKSPGMTRYAENEYLILLVNEQSGTFAVEDKTNKTTWYSSPLDDPEQAEIKADIDAADQNYMNSIISLSYYHPSGTRQYLYSNKDSVRREQYLIEKTEEGVHMTFVFGNLEAALMPVPASIAGKDFDEKVLQNETISVEDLFNIKRYYIKDATGDYVFGANLGKVAQQSALEIFTRLGIDPEKDFAASESEAGGSAKNPLFAVSVDISLEGENIRISIPVDELKFTRTFPIAGIALNEYFGAGTAEDDGYLLIPDGSGSLIDFGSPKKTEGSFSFPVYGEDVTKGLRFREEIAQSAALPVFGISKNDQGFLAVIEQGASLASVSGSKSNTVKRPYSNIYPEFSLIDQSSVVLGEGEYDAKAYTYQKSIYEGDLSVRYSFLDSGRSGYAAMANRYRESLLDAIVDLELKTEEKMADDGIPFYIEFIGAVNGNQSFLGLSYKGLEPLTTFAQVGEVVGRMQEDGVGNINVRLTGFFNGGYDQSLPVRFSPLSRLGGRSGFRRLMDDAALDAFTVYPDVVFQTAYPGDGYNINRQSSKTMDGRNARIYSYYNNVTQKGERPRYILSPDKLQTVVSSWLSKAVKLDITAVSLQDLGSRLYQDFSTKSPITREDTLAIVLAQLSGIHEKTGSIMMDYANAYAIPYADTILNVPMTDSSYLFEDRAVPFYQIAVRGIADYAGSPWNTKTDIAFEFLKSVEYGAGIHYRWIYAPSQSTKNTEQSKLFSLNYLSEYDQAVQYYRLADEILRPLQNIPILDHDAATDVENVTVTEYENGTKIYVNYNNFDVEIDGLQIEALSFAGKGGDQK